MLVGSRFKKVICLPVFVFMVSLQGFAALKPPEIKNHHFPEELGRNSCTKVSFSLTYPSDISEIRSCRVYVNDMYVQNFDQCESGLANVKLEVGDLLDETEYKFQIQSVGYDNKLSPLSKVYKVKTPACEIPKKLKTGIFLIHFSDFKNRLVWDLEKFKKEYLIQKNGYKQPLDIKEWFNQATYGQIKFDERTMGPWSVKYPLEKYCSAIGFGLGQQCNYYKLLSDIREVAGANGVDIENSFDRNVFVLTGVRTASWSEGNNIFLSAHSAYYDTYITPDISYLSLLHEVGHGFGLSHNGAFTENCYPHSLKDLSQCKIDNLGGSSVMSLGGRGFSSEERRILGVLSSRQVLRVDDKTGPFVVTLSNLNNPSYAYFKQIRIRRDLPGFEQDTFFFLDYRVDKGLYSTKDKDGKWMKPGVYISLRRGLAQKKVGESVIVDIEKPLTQEYPILHMPELKIYLRLLRATDDSAFILVSNKQVTNHTGDLPEHKP